METFEEGVGDLNRYPNAEQVLPSAFEDAERQVEVFSELHRLVSEWSSGNA